MAHALRLTAAGRALIADGANTGAAAVRLTHLALGSGQGAEGAANDGRAALRNERSRAAVSGAAAAAGQIAYRADFTPAETYSVTEAGLFGRVGASGGLTLLAYWTDNGAALAAAVPGAALTVAGVLEIQAAEADVTVSVATTVNLGDPAQAARIAAAEAALIRLGGQQTDHGNALAALRLRTSTAETKIARSTAKDAAQDGLLAGLRSDLSALRTDLTALETAALTADTIGRYLAVDVMAVPFSYSDPEEGSVNYNLSAPIGALRGVTVNRAAATVAFAAGTYWIEGEVDSPESAGTAARFDVRPTNRDAAPALTSKFIGHISSATAQAWHSGGTRRSSSRDNYVFRGVVEVAGAGSRICRFAAAGESVHGVAFIRAA